MALSDFDEYQAFTNTTAIYPADTTLQALSYLVLGLNGEAGEVAEKLKKTLRDSPGSFAELKALVLELGDVLWYLAQISEVLGYQLSAIAEMNRVKLESRNTRNALKGNGDFR